MYLNSVGTWRTEHLHRPVSLWLSDAQVDEANHRQTHIEPVAEAEIIDELENVLHTQEDETHQPLQPHVRTQSHVFMCSCTLFPHMHARNLISIVLQSKTDGPHIEQQGRYGCVALQVNQTQTVGQVALSGPDEKQPAQTTEINKLSGNYSS